MQKVALLLVGALVFYFFFISPSVDACACSSIMSEKANNDRMGGALNGYYLSDNDFEKWKDCDKVYAGPAGAALDCLKSK